MNLLRAMLRGPLPFLREAQARGGVVRLGPAFYVGDPDALRELLVDRHADFDKGVQFERAKIVIGNSLPCSDGAFHRTRRKAILPASAQARLREYFEIMHECATRDAHRWTEHTDTYVEGSSRATGSSRRTARTCCPRCSPPPTCETSCATRPSR